MEAGEKLIIETDKSPELKALKFSEKKMRNSQILYLFIYRPQTMISNGNEITEKINK